MYLLLTDMVWWIITNNKHNKGQSLIELLVVIGLMAIFIPAIAASLIVATESKPQTNNNQRAAQLVKESMEALRVIREDGWFNIASNGTYHPEILGNTWVLSSGSDNIDIFTREIVIESAQRNLNGDIVESGGIEDPATKKITITVSWNTPNPSEISNVIYFTRYLNNSAWINTTQTDFDAGIFNLTSSTSNLGANEGSWAAPAQIGTYNNPGTQDGNSVFVDGNYTYLITTNTGSDPDFTILNTTDPTNPTMVSQTNYNITITGMYINGDYAYFSTTDNSQELMIVDITNKATPLSPVALALGNNNDALSITISGNYAYVTAERHRTANELFIIDISTPTNPILTGSLDYDANIIDVKVKDNYAYLVTANTAQDVIVVNISNKAAPFIEGSYNTSSTIAASSIEIAGNYAYLTTLANPTDPELYILDISTPANPVLAGSYETTGDIYHIDVNNNFAFLTTSVSGAGITVLDVTSPSSPAFIGSTSALGARKIMTSGDYAYISSTNDLTELLIFQGGNYESTAGTVVLSEISTGFTWTSPSLITSIDNTGTGIGNKVRISGNYAYLGTNDDGSSPDFTIVNITNPGSSSVTGSLNVNANVNDVAINGDFAYLATSHDTQEFIVVNIANKSAPVSAASINLGDGTDALSIYVSGNYAFITKAGASGGQNRELYIIDITNPLAPSTKGNINVTDNFNDVFVVGNYAYIASNNSSREIQVYNISNVNSISYEGAFNYTGSSNATTIYVSGIYAFAGVQVGGSGGEVAILDISNPGAITFVGSFNVGFKINEIYYNNNILYAATEDSTREILLLDITNPVIPIQYGSADLSANANGITVDGEYGYLATSSTTQELQIVRGGFPGFETAGTYTTQTFNLGSQVTFNNLLLNLYEPAGTDIKVQYAINNDNSTWNYIGPDGTSSTYFEGSQPIPMDQSTGTYLRVRAQLTGNGTNTPSLEHISLNYSP